MSGRHRQQRRRWVQVVGVAALAVLVPVAVYSAVVLSPASNGAAPLPGPAGPVAGPAQADTGGGPGVLDRTVAVEKVVDGDSFVIEGGTTVRVLAADSCEGRTDAGPRGRADAATVLDGATVTLRREPTGRNDADRDGRLLRYVEVPGVGDLGEFMIKKPHTGVYTGFNDASADYLARLRDLDTDGRRCVDRLPDPAAEPEVAYPDCAAATTAGAAPIYAGDPGYTAKLDGNEDGVACE